MINHLIGDVEGPGPPHYWDALEDCIDPLGVRQRSLRFDIVIIDSLHGDAKAGQILLGESVIRGKPCRQLRDSEVVETVPHIPSFSSDVATLAQVTAKSVRLERAGRKVKGHHTCKSREASGRWGSMAGVSLPGIDDQTLLVRALFLNREDSDPSLPPPPEIQQVCLKEGLV